MSTKIRFEFDAERQIMIKCSSEDSPKIIEKSNLIWRDFGPQDEPYARAIFLGQGCWERLDTITEDEAQRILTQWGYLLEIPEQIEQVAYNDVILEQIEQVAHNDMTPEQIEQTAYNDLLNINWESGKSITSASKYAQFLFEAGVDYFYVPATGAFFSVEMDGNYYHGFETIVKKCSKEDVMQIAQRLLQRESSFGDAYVAHWKLICEKLDKLP